MKGCRLEVRRGMDPQLGAIIVAFITGVLGPVIIPALIKRGQEAKGKRKQDATVAAQWEAAYWSVRIVAKKHGAKDEEFESLPGEE